MAAMFLLAGCSSANDSPQPFSRFQQSSYLQGLWAETCSFPLTPENVVMIASIGNETGTPQLQCDWHRPPAGTSDSGVSLSEGVTDLDVRWAGCGQDTTLPDLVWDAVRNPGSNLVHLGDGLSPNAQRGIVLVSKCHYWDGYYCTIKRGNPNCDFPNAAQILSMVYAVLDPETGAILW